MKTLHMISATALLLAAPLAADGHTDGGTSPTLDAVATDALENDRVAWDFVEGITTEVGPRQAGTEAETRGRVWAVEWLNRHGFANVADEPFEMETWVPGDLHRAEITSPFPQPLIIQPLGGSASTGPDGITAEVVMFESVDALRAAPAGSLEGKIAYISHSMTVTQDGSQYGFAGPARWVGAGIAQEKGAVATVIKSVGTDYHRNPHVGGTTFRRPDGSTDVGRAVPTPAGALSLPDAANLERMFARADGRPIMMKLTLTPEDLGTTISGNVVGEIVGRNPNLPPVLLACHLDSWWNSPGAFDDGAGCGIIAAAALNVQKTGQPLRTIRVLFAGAEEVGLFGSTAYSEAHIDEPIAVGLESDFGAERGWRVRWRALASPIPPSSRAAGRISTSPVIRAGRSLICNKMARAISTCTTRPTTRWTRLTRCNCARMSRSGPRLREFSPMKARPFKPAGWSHRLLRLWVSNRA